MENKDQLLDSSQETLKNTDECESILLLAIDAVAEYV